MSNHDTDPEEQSLETSFEVYDHQIQWIRRPRICQMEVSFQLEISDLELKSTQMLQLLEARTRKEDQQIIRILRHIKIDIGHDYALQRAWKYLDKNTPLIIAHHSNWCLPY